MLLATWRRRQWVPPGKHQGEPDPLQLLSYLGSLTGCISDLNICLQRVKLGRVLPVRPRLAGDTTIVIKAEEQLFKHVGRADG